MKKGAVPVAAAVVVAGFVVRFTEVTSPASANACSAVAWPALLVPVTATANAPGTLATLVAVGLDVLVPPIASISPLQFARYSVPSGANDIPRLHPPVVR